MEQSLHHEMVLERVREKAKLAEEELFELRNWKVVTKQKLKLAERARDEFQKMTEELKKVLEDKENDLRHAKETTVLEYRDSDALLSEFGVSYNDGFDDALRQAKALYPKLDFSSNSLLSSGHAHDEGIDGTVSPSRDGARTGPRKGQAGGGGTVRAEEMEGGDGAEA